MSTQTHPTSRPHRTPEPTRDATKRRPAGRTIVASVVAGAVAALVLALVVFAGGTEATITGALLLGFGFGWALMATLTVRRTRQPQRWAVVPGGRHGRHRDRPGGLHPRQPDPDRVELGVAAADGGARGVDVRPDAPLGDRQGALGAHPRDRGAGPGLDRRHLRQHRAAPATRPPSPPRGSCTTSAATGSTWTATATVPPPSCSPTGSAGSPPAGRGSPAPSQRPPGSAPTTAPDRAGATTPRAPRTASSRPRTCTRSSPRPASTAPTCWSGTPPAGPTR